MSGAVVTESGLLEDVEGRRRIILELGRVTMASCVLGWLLLSPVFTCCCCCLWRWLPALGHELGSAAHCFLRLCACLC
jgi:hypothetical protein